MVSTRAQALISPPRHADRAWPRAAVRGLLVHAQLHYKYSMPHPVATAIIPVCLVVTAVGVGCQAYSRRTGLSLFTLALCAAGVGLYLKFEQRAETILHGQAVPHH